MYLKFDYPWQEAVFGVFMKRRKNLSCAATKAKHAIRERLRDRMTTLRERIVLHNALRELQILFPQHSDQQEFRDVKSTSEPPKVLEIPLDALRARILKARRRVKTSRSRPRALREFLREK